ncbi:helix-turn-helix transcriptional regulator [Brevibacterium casei]|uniref:helix-turn-helix transcriptional regulator n=1 Tax=Brevibacterium casei TaxID=33889 RepID=UPI0039EFA75C
MLSTAEAAEHLGVSASTLRFWRHVADGTGPKSFRVGKKLVYYAEEDLEAWLLDQYERSVKA